MQCFVINILVEIKKKARLLKLPALKINTSLSFRFEIVSTNLEVEHKLDVCSTL